MIEHEFSNVTKVWNSDHTANGVIQSISSRYCAGCGAEHRCLVVKWANGKISKPCTAGLNRLSDSEMQIN